MKDTIQDLLNILAEVEGWNEGDADSFKRFGEVPIDGSFVFSARRKKITELKQKIQSLKKS